MGLLSESAQSLPPSTPRRAPPREPCSYSSFSNGQESRDCPALRKSCRMLRPPCGLEGSAARLRCQEGGAGGAVWHNSAYTVIRGSLVAAARVGMPPASNIRCQASWPLQWFQCVCGGGWGVYMRGPGAQVWTGRQELGRLLTRMEFLGAMVEESKVAWGGG